MNAQAAPTTTRATEFPSIPAIPSLTDLLKQEAATEVWLRAHGCTDTRCYPDSAANGARHADEDINLLTASSSDAPSFEIDDLVGIGDDVTLLGKNGLKYEGIALNIDAVESKLLARVWDNEVGSSYTAWWTTKRLIEVNGMAVQTAEAVYTSPTVCRCCGEPMRQEWQPPLLPWQTGHWLVTCDSGRCALRDYTFTTDTYRTVSLDEYLGKEIPA